MFISLCVPQDDTCATVATASTIFASLVRKSYTRSRNVPIPPGAAHKLAATDIGISIHSSVMPSVSDTRVAVAALRPSSIARGKIRVLTRLGDLSDPENLQAPVLAWSAASRTCYVLASMCTDIDASDVVTAMYTSGVRPGRGKYLLSGDDAAEGPKRDTLDRLEGLGFVQLLASRPGCSEWQLTKQGMQELVPARHLQNPVPAIRVRSSIPLEDKTSYEMLCALEDRGWAWQFLKPKEDAQEYIIIPL